MTSHGTPGEGVFITFEGIDGTGKSTQTALLARWLAEKGFDVVQTREPGGTRLGAELRRLLLGPRRWAPVEADVGDVGEADIPGPVPTAEMLLMAADRAQHVELVIRPALAAGKVVVSDRYVDSSLAYQAAGLGLPEADVRGVNEVATGGLLPHLTILLDLDPARAYERDEGPPDRIERRGVAFQARVRAAYHRLVQQHPERWLTLSVDGKSVEAVHAEVTRAVDRLMARRGVSPGRGAWERADRGASGRPSGGHDVLEPRRMRT